MCNSNCNCNYTGYIMNQCDSCCDSCCNLYIKKKCYVKKQYIYVTHKSLQSLKRTKKCNDCDLTKSLKRTKNCNDCDLIKSKDGSWNTVYDKLKYIIYNNKN